MEYIEKLDIIKDIKILEKTFRFRPICLRNIRISSTLLQRGAKAGLTLAQIGALLCRPDEDDSKPSILEIIVDKSRLIADMVVKMQGKKKFSRGIVDLKEGFGENFGNPSKKIHSQADEDEFKFGAGAGAAVGRERKYSHNEESV